MARPKLPVSQRRRNQIKLTLSDDELELVRGRAGEDTVAEYARMVLLQGARPRRRRLIPSPAEVAAVAKADRVKAEVAEAKLPDLEAELAFIERRAKELHGQGSTMVVARRLAAREWLTRGA